MKVFAIFRSTSGAILGTRSLYSPINQMILARAMGTVIVSTIRDMWIMMSLWVDDCICNNFLITTTLSATTPSVIQHTLIENVLNPAVFNNLYNIRTQN